jgi:hypothetical protein
MRGDVARVHFRALFGVVRATLGADLALEARAPAVHRFVVL